MLRSVQQGVQSQHADRELTNKYVYSESYGSDDPTYLFLKDWSLHHKTSIYLNGGFHQNMTSLLEFLSSTPLVANGVTLPWAAFHEDAATLNGLLTSIAIILPESIYDAVDYNRFIRSEAVDLPKFMKKHERSTSESDYFWINPETSLIEVTKGSSAVGKFQREFLKATGLAT
jgi:hypothetical protein